jgi:hypothetical protein
LPGDKGRSGGIFVGRHSAVVGVVVRVGGTEQGFGTAAVQLEISGQ